MHRLPTSPFTTAEARAVGISRRALRAAILSGELRRTSRGVYARPEALDVSLEHWELTREQHLASARAALRRFPGAVASHTTAAVAHGLDLVISATTPVDLTVIEGFPTSRRCDGLVVHHTDSIDTAFVEVEGLRVTPLDRTVADVLRTRRLPHGVGMLDRALVDRRTTVQQVERVLAEQRRWRGRPRAMQALRLTDPVRESWLESFSFVQLHELGLDMPRPQVEIFDEHFSFVGRVDGLWPGERTFAEADGESKYFLASDPEAGARTTLAHEHARHWRLESLGLVGVRWTGHEMLRAPEAVAARVRVAHGRGRGMTFRGWVRSGDRFVRLESLVGP